MKILLMCTKCESDCLTTFRLVEPREDGRYLATCSKGHEIVAALQMLRFEMLFEMGLHAILDGYTREAVSSFHASYERFHEFYFRVSCRVAGISTEVAEQSWKALARQSERQLGAFVMAHLLQERSSPALLNDDLVNLRNKVIHRGFIPARQEAVGFGQAIFDKVHPVMQGLRERFPEHFFSEIEDVLRAAGWHDPNSDSVWPHGLATMMNAGTEIRPGPPTKVDQYLDRLAKMRDSLFAIEEAERRMTRIAPPLVAK